MSPSFRLEDFCLSVNHKTEFWRLNTCSYIFSYISSFFRKVIKFFWQCDTRRVRGLIKLKTPLHDHSSFLLLRKFSLLRCLKSDIGKTSSIRPETHGSLPCESEQWLLSLEILIVRFHLLLYPTQFLNPSWQSGTCRRWGLQHILPDIWRKGTITNVT